MVGSIERRPEIHFQTMSIRLHGCLFGHLSVCRFWICDAQYQTSLFFTCICLKEIRSPFLLLWLHPPSSPCQKCLLNYIVLIVPEFKSSLPFQKSKGRCNTKEGTVTGGGSGNGGKSFSNRSIPRIVLLSNPQCLVCTLHRSQDFKFWRQLANSIPCVSVLLIFAPVLAWFFAGKINGSGLLPFSHC